MGTFKKITESTVLTSGMLIRELNKQTEDFDSYIIGNLNGNNSFEVYPEGEDYLNKAGVLFNYPKRKMINRGCEFWED
jgi:hypothetical protein